MTSVFPGALDNLPADKTDATQSSGDHAAHHNALADALNATQAYVKTLAAAAVAVGSTPLSLYSPWSYYGGGYKGPAYYRDATGRVFLTGLLANSAPISNGGGANSTIAKLPAGFRPSGNELFDAIAADAQARVDVYPDGNIVLQCAMAANGWVALDGISFMAAGGPYTSAKAAPSDPVGSVITWTSNADPDDTDWVIADGRRLSAAAYPEGYAFATKAVAAATAAGAPGLWTVRTSDQTFTVPNMRDAFTWATSVVADIGKRGGEATTALTEAQLPSHVHPITAIRYINTAPAAMDSNPGWLSEAPRSSTGLGGAAYTASAGGGQAHNNMPPYVVGTAIVRVRSTASTGGAVPKHYTLGAAGAPTFGTGWTSYQARFPATPPFTLPGFSVAPDGQVTLKGLASRSSGSGATIFVLPPEARPGGWRLFPTWVGAGAQQSAARIDILPTGEVNIAGGIGTNVAAPTESVTLDGISYYVGQ